MRTLCMAGSLLFLLPYALAVAAERPGDEILGHWYTEDNESQVKIVKRTTSDGETRYFGTLVWFKDPVYDDDDPEAGKPLRDRENRDPSKRDMPLLGLEILKDFKYDAGDRAWNGGTIYDPEVGKTYKCTMKLTADASAHGGKRLDVRGYVGVPLLGRTTIWVRVPEDELPKSDAADSDS